MIMAYYQAFDSGRSIAFKNHDRRLTAGFRADKWYKNLLIMGMRGLGIFSTGLSILYALISFGLFILNIYLFGQGSRNTLLGGWLAGYNIVYIELTCLVIMFFTTLWVTSYSISKQYPTTVFTTWGKMSSKMKVDMSIEMAEEKGWKRVTAEDGPGVITVKERSPKVTGKGAGKRAAKKGTGTGAARKAKGTGVGKAKPISKGSRKGTKRTSKN